MKRIFGYLHLVNFQNSDFWWTLMTFQIKLAIPCWPQKTRFPSDDHEKLGHGMATKLLEVSWLNRIEFWKFQFFSKIHQKTESEDAFSEDVFKYKPEVFFMSVPSDSWPSSLFFFVLLFDTILFLHVFLGIISFSLNFPKIGSSLDLPSALLLVFKILQDFSDYWRSSESNFNWFSWASLSFFLLWSSLCSFSRLSIFKETDLRRQLFSCLI